MVYGEVASVNLKRVTAAPQTPTSTAPGALYDLVSPYIVPVIAGLIVIALVWIFTGSTPTGRRVKTNA